MSSLKQLKSRLNLERAQYHAVKDSDLFTEAEKTQLLPKLETYVTHTTTQIENHPDRQRSLSAITVYGAVEVSGRP